MLNKHKWIKINLNIKGKTAQHSFKCEKCGLIKYKFYDETRFRYPDGALMASRTIDEPSCWGPQEV